MSVEKISLYMSIIATTLAVLSFCGTIWRIWRDRPRLVFYVSKTNIHNKPDNKEFKMIQIKACNIGFRPIILTSFIAVGRKSSFCMGINDIPAAYYRVEKQIFPSILDPGRTLTFHPLHIEGFEKNALDLNDANVFYDPWLYFALEDSFGDFYPLNIKDVRWSLNMDKSRKYDTMLEILIEYFRRKRIFYNYRRLKK